MRGRFGSRAAPGLSTGRSTCLSTGLSLALAAVVLSACSTTSSTEPTPSPSLIGGEAACDEAAITQVVQTDIDANYPGSTFVSLDSFSCEAGWAIVRTQIDESGATLPAVVFLRAEGQFWVPSSIEEICAKPQAESSVPQSIYVEACGVQ